METKIERTIVNTIEEWKKIHTGIKKAQLTDLIFKKIEDNYTNKEIKKNLSGSKTLPTTDKV